MSSSAKPGRVIRDAPHGNDEVFVLGQGTRYLMPVDGVMATAGDVIQAGHRRSDEIVASAESEAAMMIAEARASVDAVRAAAYDDGYQGGLRQAESEITACVELVRRAAADGKATRDEIAGQAAGVVARAVALATRRIVGEYYESDPTRTAAVIGEALRAAAGQEILAIRVHSGLVESVSALLTDVAGYVRPDTAVAIGGCIIDLRNGTIDATLDARLSLLEDALADAGGEASR